ncbi:membrane protein [Gordonia phage Ligma]|nr:membrane protein [Gordonia phage Ligma]UQT02185.1 hypothetical protein SEA_AXUMITE_86 [Gordonia phage Axumite]
MTAAAMIAFAAFLAGWRILTISDPGTRAEFWGAITMLIGGVLVLGITYIIVTT